jgi:hypothetical protein
MAPLRVWLAPQGFALVILFHYRMKVESKLPYDRSITDMREAEMEPRHAAT